MVYGSLAQVIIINHTRIGNQNLSKLTRTHKKCLIFCLPQTNSMLVLFNIAQRLALAKNNFQKSSQTDKVTKLSRYYYIAWILKHRSFRGGKRHQRIARVCVVYDNGRARKKRVVRIKTHVQPTRRGACARSQIIRWWEKILGGLTEELLTTIISATICLFNGADC